MKPRHFLTLNSLNRNELLSIINRASVLKKQTKEKNYETTLNNRVLGMIFEKSSTRTRVSFEAGMVQLGGHAIYLSPTGSQIGRGEPIKDTARVLSQMVDSIMLRTFEHERLENFAFYSDVPVINGLTDSFHPCQLLADLMTYYENRGSIEGKKVVWLGDGNNMCHSYMNAAKIFNFQLILSCPEGYDPDASLLESTKEFVSIERDPRIAIKNTDLVVTDVWTSMGQEKEKEQRLEQFVPYQVNTDLMKYANEDALFMHCLPAHRGEEVSEDILEGSQSVVWEEAGNRLHSQKALLEFLLS
ncbi:MAG: ornithine carbamoyltransferase [Legionellales bacterium]|nr:ornithine carbamoyltransferase [Legionellales bacterium]|tara:strand:- start:587 stop:1489 length:903 start_codon:yes stop_codon:yes gene_type:complete